MKKTAKKLINRPLNRVGFQLDRFSPKGEIFTAIEAFGIDHEIYKLISHNTMVAPDPIYSLMTSVRYIVENEIEGDFVECGTWRGGCSMAIALTLIDLGATDRIIWVYDTFAGMTKPSFMDVTNDKQRTSAEALMRNNAADALLSAPKDSLEAVKANLYSTGYPPQNLRFIEGDVLDTLQSKTPKLACLLRLDTDWYESTCKELEVLYPILTEGGVCIVDDYGAWAGSKQAVDEYFIKYSPRPLMHATNWTVRTWIKTTITK